MIIPVLYTHTPNNFWITYKIYSHSELSSQEGLVYAQKFLSRCPASSLRVSSRQFCKIIDDDNKYVYEGERFTSTCPPDTSLMCLPLTLHWPLLFMPLHLPPLLYLLPCSLLPLFLSSSPSLLFTLHFVFAASSPHLFPLPSLFPTPFTLSSSLPPLHFSPLTPIFSLSPLSFPPSDYRNKNSQWLTGFFKPIVEVHVAPRMYNIIDMP